MWEEVEDRTELPHIDLPTLMAICVSFPFSTVAQPDARGPSSLLSAGFLYRILSPTNWLPVITELYNSPTAHSIYPHNWPSEYVLPRLWNGMFDRHQAEITVMQFTGHSLPVHQFVIVPWDFNPVPYCQPNSLTPMEYALPPSLGWHVWRGRRSIYNKFLHGVHLLMDQSANSAITFCRLKEKEKIFLTYIYDENQTITVTAWFGLVWFYGISTTVAKSILYI